MFYNYMQGVFRDLASVGTEEQYKYKPNRVAATPEQWKALGDGYFVSSYGRVRGPRKILKPMMTTQGYPAVNIKGKRKLIHRLVAEAFISNPDNLPIVNHIDGNRHNAVATNLEWVTQRENVLHGIYVSPVGNRPRCKVKCTETGEEYSSISEAARQNGFDRNRFRASISYNNTYGGLHWEVTKQY